MGKTASPADTEPLNNGTTTPLNHWTTELLSDCQPCCGPLLICLLHRCTRRMRNIYTVSRLLGPPSGQWSHSLPIANDHTQKNVAPCPQSFVRLVSNSPVEFYFVFCVFFLNIFYSVLRDAFYEPTIRFFFVLCKAVGGSFNSIVKSQNAIVVGVVCCCDCASLFKPGPVAWMDFILLMRVLGDHVPLKPVQAQSKSLWAWPWSEIRQLHSLILDIGIPFISLGKSQDVTRPEQMD